MWKVNRNAKCSLIKTSTSFLMNLFVLAILLGNATMSNAENFATSWPSIQNFIDATHLIDFKQGSELSGKVSDSSAGGFETAQGNFVSFKQWYQTNWTDTKTVWMTEINPNLGVIWGFSRRKSREI